MSEQPPIYMPTEAATAVAPDGRRLVFFTVPQMEPLIRQLMAERPSQFTYRWGYHPGQRVHVLLVSWSDQQAAAIAIPEGVGDQILTFMTGTTDVFWTIIPVQDKLTGDVEPTVIAEITAGVTVGMPGIQFTGQG